MEKDEYGVYEKIMSECGGVVIIFKEDDKTVRFCPPEIAQEFKKLRYPPEEFRRDINSKDAFAYSKAKYLLLNVQKMARAQRSDVKVGFLLEFDETFEVLQLDPITAT
jgi:hypothetical protein